MWRCSSSTGSTKKSANTWAQLAPRNTVERAINTLKLLRAAATRHEGGYPSLGTATAQPLASANLAACGCRSRQRAYTGLAAHVSR